MGQRTGVKHGCETVCGQESTKKADNEVEALRLALENLKRPSS